MWNIQHHLNQAAEFGYVRTPGHNAGCQCLSCQDTGREWAVDHLFGLYHSRTRGVTIVLVPAEPGYLRAIFRGGVQSVRLDPSEVVRVIGDYEYEKIGGR